MKFFNVNLLISHITTVFIRHSHDWEDLRNEVEGINMMKNTFPKIVQIQKSKNIYNMIIYQITCQLNGRPSYNS